MPSLRFTGKRMMCSALLLLTIAMVGPGRLALGQAPKSEGAASPAAAPDSSAARPEPGTRATVTEDVPVFYVRDQNGRLVPLLGFKYEEILQFVQQKKREGAAQRAGYSLQQLVCTGQTKEGRAEFDATYTIRLESDGWVEIPLVGAGAVLSEPARHEGPGEYEMRFDAAAASYTARLRAPKQSDHTIVMHFLTPVRNVEGESRIEFELPAAPASRLSLQVAEPDVELSNHDGAAEAQVKPVEGGSRIEIWGLGGRLTLGWKSVDPRLTRSASTLEATGQILARIDSHSVQFDAMLTLRSRKAEFDRIHIKLPPGAQYSGSERADAGYTITASSQAGSQLLEVQLAEKTVGPVQIRVQAERPYDVTRPNEALELAGFEVIEALPHRQWGHIAVAVQGDWQITWQKLNRARQIGELPAGLQQTDVIAGFEYFGQPASLTARVTPRKTRINVEPEYVYSVGAKELRLEGRLRYTIRGAKAFDLDFELPGWEIDEIGPSNLVDTESGLSAQGKLISVSLLEPTTGSLDLTIRAHRELPPGTLQFEFALPVLHCDVQGPATVVVVPADNVQLRPLDDEIEGLLRQSTAPNLPLPAGQQPAWFYRAESPGARFVADMEVLPQVLAATIESSIDLRRDEVLVEQTLSYRIEHEPATSLTLDVPQALLGEPKATFLVDGKPQTIRTSAAQSDSPLARVELPLGAGRLGNVEVTVRYRLPQVALSPVGGTPLEVPLVMPAKVALAGNQVKILAETGIQWDVSDSPWVPPGGNLQPGASPLIADQLLPSLPLSLTLDRRGPRTTVVQRAWVQTWLSHGVRQDRVVYRFKSTEERLQISLPMGAQGSRVEARFDGRLLEPPTQGALTITLPPRPSNEEHLLELRYQLDEPLGSREMNLPSIEGSVWTQRMYWQLVVPRDRHLISCPEPLTPEFSWQWNGTHWQRQSSWDQPELENWVGAASEAELPQATNRYLFSTMGRLGTIDIWLAPRWQIVFIASLAVLVTGLAFLYLPAVRQPGVLLGAAIVLFAIALWRPDAGLLLAQAGLLGVVLAAAAAALRQMVVRRHWRGMVVRSPGSSISERDSTRRRVRLAEPARPASDVAPAVLEASTSDSQGG